MADEAKVGPAGEPERSEPSTRSRTWLWMILSLVIVGGFLAWLGMASEPTTVAVSEEDAEAAASGEGGENVPTVLKDTLAANEAAYEGQRIRVPEVEATAQLGPRIFWGELGDPANQVPILVRLDSAAAEGWQMRSGALYTLTGEVRRMSDSLAAAWGEQGEFSGEGEQMQATFTEYFIQTSRIRPSRGTSSGGGAGSDADEASSDG